jgi:hypothetical protein
MRKVFFAILASLLACTDSATDAGLVGVYVAAYKGDRATLFLNADYTYRHVIQAQDGQRLEDGSTWHVHRPDGSSRHMRLVFANFRVVPAFMDEKRAIVGWSTSVEKTWLGRYQLCFDSDVGYCYVKQSGS